LTTFIQEEVPSRFQLCILLSLNSMLTRPSIFDRLCILTHTHRRSGYTSHIPPGRVPPHGPLRKRFGHL
jgi:hypothetical protein